MDTQVLIVGAGPAGTQLGRDLAGAGIHCIIIERELLPRYKACGGAVSQKALDLFAEDLSPELVPVERVARRVTFRHPGERPVNRSCLEPGITLVMRDSFDYFLAEEAASAGARLHQGETVKEVRVYPDGVLLSTDVREYRAEMVIGADGARGVVARSQGVRPRRAGAALEVELEVAPSEVTDGIILDYGVLPGGYSWVFPKKNHLSVGTGFLSGGRVSLRGILDDYFVQLGLEEHARGAAVYGHPVPIGITRPLAGHRFLLVGDAAGLADPLTGEGIYYALRSSRLASEVITDAINRNDPSLAPYPGLIRRELGADLKAAGRIMQLFTRWPALFHRMIQEDADLLDAFLAMIQGTGSYREIYRRASRSISSLLRALRA